MDIKRKCSICKGTLLHEQAGTDGSYGGALILFNVACPCTRTDYPGFDFVGTANFGDNIFPSYQILEELDATEHNALSDSQKDGVLAILACGLVDLNDGKAGKTRLWNWFGAGSTTVANLTALLT